MEETTVPNTFGELIEALNRQQANFQAMMQHQFAASEARLDALSTKAPAARKSQPPTHQGRLTEDLELWFFSIEQYYADYHPQMVEDSPQFVTVISCHLGVTPMNWYRQFLAECDTTGRTKSWGAFKAAMRRRFLPLDHEFVLRERLWALSQKGSLHDYIAEFQNLLIQCTQQISPLELRFYFQQGLKPATSNHLREHHPQNLDAAMELALRFDHSGDTAQRRT
ncbi:hypothetical protein PR001_g32487, partial [Phytophthora rubi]